MTSVYSIGYLSTNSISYDDFGLTLTIFMYEYFCMGESLSALSANVYPGLF